MSILQANSAGLGGKGDPGGALGSFYSTTIDQSLRFNDDDSAKLYFDPTVDGNKQVWTFSAWVKRGNLGISPYSVFFSGANSSGHQTDIRFDSADQLRVITATSSLNMDFKTNRVFRDAGSWYHIVVAVDTTDATLLNRVKIYVNGVQETSLATTTCGLNTNCILNTASNQTTSVGALGYTTTVSAEFDGHMAEVHFVDGTQYAASDFGETINGIWVPKQVSGLTYGTNGFYLPFAQDVSSGSSAFFSDSGNSYVQFTDASLYDIGSSDDFTIEFFFNPTTSAINDYQHLFGNYVGTSGPYMSVQSDLRSSQKLFYFYYGNGAAYTFGPATDDFVAGQWYHVAINRVSGNLRFFLNGTQLGSTQTSNTQSWNNNDVRIAQSQSNGTNGFDGYMSNARMVVGSAVYADGASITVPTATLTDVTNTKLLALTTSTITQDASSNNVTGTLSGSGYFSSELSPFADFNFYDDTSGNGNNFTAINLVTSDVVPDSPTNSFATVNSIYRGSNTNTAAYGLTSEGNLKFSYSSNSDAGTLCTHPFASGKYYWELRIVAGGGSSAYQHGTGIANIGAGYRKITNIMDGRDPNEIGMNSYTGAVRQGSSTVINTLSTTAMANGSIIGCAVDADNGAIYWSYNGTFMNSSDPTSGASKTNAHATWTPADGDMWVPTILAGGGSVPVNVINFGQDSTFAGGTTAGGNSDENGYGDFKYAPPSGYLALSTANLPEPAIGPNSTTTSDQHFNTVLWTGNGSTQSITGVGFSPDFVWNKARSTAQRHALWDTVRGATKILNSDATDAETTSSGLTSFDADGWTTGSSYNQSGYTFASWNWKAGGTAVSNTDGSITSSVSANPDAGFSICTWTSTASTGTVGHGLNSAPELIIAKPRNASGTNWYVMHTPGGVVPANQILNLDSTAAKFTPGVAHFNSTYPTSTVFSIGGYLGTGTAPNNDKLAYCFHSVEGFSKVGSFEGNSSGTNGPFVYTGFRPAFVIGKAIDQTGRWWMYDSARTTYNDGGVNNGRRLEANSSSAETTGDSSNMVEFYSNGFKVNTTNSEWNGSNLTYIYLAFAESPFKYANAR